MTYKKIWIKFQKSVHPDELGENEGEFEVRSLWLRCQWNLHTLPFAKPEISARNFANKPALRIPPSQSAMLISQI